MAVLEEQELACHRYAGDDPTILAPVEAKPLRLSLGTRTG